MNILDIAHIDSIKHLEDIVSIKKPDMLHISDKHFDVIHKHMPIGHNDIDFEYIFKTRLPDYAEKIILEIVRNDSDIKNSKNLIESLLK